MNGVYLSKLEYFVVYYKNNTHSYMKKEFNKYILEEIYKCLIKLEILYNIPKIHILF